MLARTPVVRPMLRDRPLRDSSRFIVQAIVRNRMVPLATRRRTAHTNPRCSGHRVLTSCADGAASPVAQVSLVFAASTVRTRCCHGSPWLGDHFGCAERAQLLSGHAEWPSVLFCRSGASTCQCVWTVAGGGLRPSDAAIQTLLCSRDHSGHLSCSCTRCVGSWG